MLALDVPTPAPIIDRQYPAAKGLDPPCPVAQPSPKTPASGLRRCWTRHSQALIQPLTGLANRNLVWHHWADSAVLKGGARELTSSARNNDPQSLAKLPPSVGRKMTTEIAVSNQLGIALATDSAVTITGGGHTKVFDTADKLFELSAMYPVAVMINGNMDCLGTPWEILIKDFRNAEGSKPRGGIEKWARDFLAYIEQHDKDVEDSAGGFVERAILAEINRAQQLILFVIRDFVFSSWDEKSPVLSRKGLDVSKVLAVAIKIRRERL